MMIEVMNDVFAYRINQLDLGVSRKWTCSNKLSSWYNSDNFMLRESTLLLNRDVWSSNSMEYLKWHHGMSILGSDSDIFFVSSTVVCIVVLQLAKRGPRNVRMSIFCPQFLFLNIFCSNINYFEFRVIL